MGRETVDIFFFLLNEPEQAERPSEARRHEEKRRSDEGYADDRGGPIGGPGGGVSGDGATDPQMTADEDGARGGAEVGAGAGARRPGSEVPDFGSLGQAVIGAQGCAGAHDINRAHRSTECS